MVRRRSTVRFRKGAPPGFSRAGLCARRGGVAQLAEQAAHNRCVAGSSPATATLRDPLLDPALHVCVGSVYAGMPLPDREQVSRKAPRRGQGDRRPSEDHPGVYGVQGAELHHPEEPPERPRPHRTAEVLPARWPPHPAPRDPLSLPGFQPTHHLLRRPADRGSAHGSLRGMPLDPSFVGRTYPPTDPYLVGREKIREFARAIGADDAAYHDPEAARAIGYADVVAPPTFPVVITMSSSHRQIVEDPELGIDYGRVVHGDQRFSYARPVVAGDALVCLNTVEEITRRGGHDFMTTRTDVRTETGEPVVTVWSKLVQRGEDPRS